MSIYYSLDFNIPDSRDIIIMILFKYSSMLYQTRMFCFCSQLRLVWFTFMQKHLLLTVAMAAETEVWLALSSKEHKTGRKLESFFKIKIFGGWGGNY